MKSLSFVLTVVLMSLATVVFAQSDAQKSFAQLKTLAGSWQGPVTVDPPMPEMGGRDVHTGLAARGLPGKRAGA